MDFFEFEDYFRDYLENRFGESNEVRISDTLKNNGITLRAVTVWFKDQTACPTVYLEDLYSDYEMGMDINEVCKKAGDILEGARMACEPDLSFCEDSELLLKRVLCKLINTRRNETLLTKVPHIEFLDLSAVFYVIVSDDTAGCGSVLIDNQMVENLNMDVSLMYLAAVENNKKILKACVAPIESILYEMAKEANTADALALKAELEERKELGFEIPMFVLTNEYKINGAACMLDEELLFNLSESFDKDYYILPSSIHELIVVLDDETDCDVSQLKSMVKQVNSTEVSPKDVLSDSVYLYSRTLKKVMRL